ncbi:MAG: hypothetical protein U5L09_10315 [Bacteroidales bacterium]|nr:hypothetical protein [Bacteroidales bacterium]
MVRASTAELDDGGAVEEFCGFQISAGIWQHARSDLCCYRFAQRRLRGHIRSLTRKAFEEKCRQEDKEGEIYRKIDALLSDKKNQQTIRDHYPDPEIHRRNTGYALDLLLDNEIFGNNNKPLNLSTIINDLEVWPLSQRLS